MTDSGHRIGEGRGDGVVVVDPQRGILPWTCRTLACQAKAAYMERRGMLQSEAVWQCLVDEGFRLQRVTLCPASPPFEGRANVTLAFEKMLSERTEP
jgi:hypothetical protein